MSAGGPAWGGEEAAAVGFPPAPPLPPESGCDLCRLLDLFPHLLRPGGLGLDPSSATQELWGSEHIKIK